MSIKQNIFSEGESPGYATPIGTLTEFCLIFFKSTQSTYQKFISANNVCNIIKHEEFWSISSRNLNSIYKKQHGLRFKNTSSEIRLLRVNSLLHHLPEMLAPASSTVDRDNNITHLIAL